LLKKLLLSLTVALSTFTAVAAQGASAYSLSEANDVIATGQRYIGTPYRFGADYGQTRYFDCSSFVKTVYAKNGITLPRSSRDQAQVGTYVSKRNLKKGDLVFFRSAGSTSNRITHVAIYAGNDKLLHTYGAGGVRFSDFNSYWDKRYVKAKRVL
jgi:cell wall-associated NlpC family hydrolase